MNFKVTGISISSIGEIENGCINEEIYTDQLANVSCGKKCEKFCELMTTNQQNCLSFCDFDEFCDEESGSNQETESISSPDQEDTDGSAEESSSSNESAESSGSGSSDESSSETSWISETNTYFEDLYSDSDTTPSHDDDSWNESIIPYDAHEDESEASDEEDNSSDEEGSETDEQGSATEEQDFPLDHGTDFIWTTGSEWEASIQDLTYYGEGCENGRCHDGVINSSFVIDDLLIQHEHHPHDYTLDKICWIRRNFHIFFC